MPDILRDASAALAAAKRADKLWSENLDFLETLAIAYRRTKNEPAAFKVEEEINSIKARYRPKQSLVPEPNSNK